MKKTKSYLKYAIVLIGLMLIIIISGCVKEEITKTTSITDTSIQVKLSLSRTPVLGQTTDVIATITSTSDIPDASAEIVLPQGFEAVNGNLSWGGGLTKNKEVQFNTTVKAVEEGDWKIEAYASGQAETTSIKAEDVIYTTTVSEKVSPSGEIYMNMSEYCSKRHRTFDVGIDGMSIPEPRKGEALNNYFKSLNLTKDYVYVMMQFEACDGDPTKEQIQTLATDGITLFEYHGDHTYYAKVPRIVLETKSYYFVRWIGVVDNESLKLHSDLKELLDKNCTGRIDLSINFYENLNNEQFEDIKEISDGCLIGYKLNCDSISNDNLISMEVDITKLEEVISLNFVKKVNIVPTSTSLPGGPGEWITHKKDPFADINCME